MQKRCVRYVQLCDSTPARNITSTAMQHACVSNCPGSLACSGQHSPWAGATCSAYVTLHSKVAASSQVTLGHMLCMHCHLLMRSSSLWRGGAWAHAGRASPSACQQSPVLEARPHSRESLVPNETPPPSCYLVPPVSFWILQEWTDNVHLPLFWE